MKSRKLSFADKSLGPASRVELADSLRHVLRSLDTDSRQALWLFHVRGLTIDQIADRLQISTSNVDRRLAAARDRLITAILK